MVFSCIVPQYYDYACILVKWHISGHTIYTELPLYILYIIGMKSSSGVSFLYIFVVKKYMSASSVFIIYTGMSNKSRKGFQGMQECYNQDGTVYCHTPLFCAAWRGDNMMVHLMLASNVNADEVDRDGNTPLFIASQMGHNMVVEQLLAHGCDKDKFNNDKVTPLAAAVGNRQIQVVQLLLDFGCNTNQADVFGKTALYWAISIGGNKGEAVVKLLLKAGCATDTVQHRSENKTPLYLAAASGYTRVVSYLLLAADCPKDKADNTNITPLAVAVKNRHIRVVKLLLEAGCKVDEADSFENNAIYWAASGGNESMVKLLLAAGARTDIANQCGYTPLRAAYRGRHSDVMRLLQKHEQVVQMLRAAGSCTLQNIKDYYNRETYIVRILNHMAGYSRT